MQLLSYLDYSLQVNKNYETIEYSLDSAPEAFIGMLQGANLGKQLARLT